MTYLHVTTPAQWATGGIDPAPGEALDPCAHCLSIANLAGHDVRVTKYHDGRTARDIRVSREAGAGRREV